jgi:RNA-splicing ligase RtcB
MRIDGKYTSATIYAENVEQTCLEQIEQMVNNEQFCNPIAIMPDCHAGYGSVIGFTMKIGDKLAPNVVGVDAECYKTMLKHLRSL